MISLKPENGIQLKAYRSRRTNARKTAENIQEFS